MAKLEKRFQAFIKKNDRFKMHTLTKIPEADIKSAEKFIKIMSLNTEEDYLLFFSSAILISSNNKMLCSNNKVNRLEKHDRYLFKHFISSAIENAIYFDDKCLKFCCTMDKNGKPLIYVNLLGVQFSFHEVVETPLMAWARICKLPQYQKQEWDYTPLQKGASELFHYALEQDNLSRIGMDGSNAHPRDIVNKNKIIEKKKAEITLSTAVAQSKNISLNKISEAEMGN